MHHKQFILDDFFTCHRCNATPSQEAPEMRGSLFVFLTGDIVRYISLTNMRYAFEKTKKGERLTTSLKHSLNTKFRE